MIATAGIVVIVAVMIRANHFIAPLFKGGDFFIHSRKVEQNIQRAVKMAEVGADENFRVICLTANCIANVQSI